MANSTRRRNGGLTAIQVREKTCPRGVSRIEVPDGKGLYLVVQATGSKSWAHRYVIGGKREKLTLGPALILGDDEREPDAVPVLGAPLTLAQARQLLADQQRQLARGVNPADAVRAAKARQARQLIADPHQSPGGVAKASPPLAPDTFEAVARNFLRRHAREHTRQSSYNESTRLLGFVKHGHSERGDDVLAVRGDAKPYPLTAWRRRRLQDISKKDVIALLDDIEDERSTNASDLTFGVLRKLMNWSVERDTIPVTPMRDLKKRGETVKRKRVLITRDGDASELRLAWLAADRIGYPFGHLVKLLILTGCRKSEWARARWSEVDLRRCVFELPAERSKNGLAHTVPLPPQAVAVLEDLQRKRQVGKPDWLFSTGTGRRTDPEAPLVPIQGYSQFKSKLDRAALEIARQEAADAGEEPAEVEIAAWTIHDLRRSYATGLAMLRVPVEVIERGINHISGTFEGVVGVYQLHAFDAEIRDANARWGAAVDRIVAGEPLVKPNVVMLTS